MRKLFVNIAVRDLDRAVEFRGHSRQREEVDELVETALASGGSAAGE